MKHLVLFVFVLLVFWCLESQAVLVHYVDDDGKVHYVNPHLSKIPQKYLQQVRPQLEALKPKAVMTAVNAATNAENTPATEEPVSPPPKEVEIFIDDNCAACILLQQQLTQNQIPYKRFHVQYDPYAQKIFAEKKGNPPVTKIGNIFVYGNDIAAIRKAMGKTEWPENEWPENP